MPFFDTTWYINFGNGVSTGYYALPLRQASFAYTAGQIVRQFTVPAVNSERCFVCIIAGTTAAATDATWVLTRGAKTVDGTVTWIECTGATSMNGDVVNTPNWTTARSVSVSLGAIIKRNNGVSYQVCTVTGTTGTVEPAFSDVAGAVVVDNGATWTSLGPVGNFTAGGAPHARLQNALVGTWFASGNTVYVGDNSVESQGASPSLSPASALLAKIICHNHSGSYPPAVSDITTGASITCTSGGIALAGQGSFYFYGITFITTNTTSTIFIGQTTIGQIQNWYYLDNCSLSVNSASSFICFGPGSGTGWSIITLNNTTVKFGSTATYIYPYFCQLTWQNTGPILAPGSVVPTTFIQFQNTASGRFFRCVFKNLDLSQLTGSLFSNSFNSTIGTLLVQDCKLNSAMTVTQPINTGMRVELFRSDSAGTYYKSSRITYEAIETTETTVVRTGGAVDPSGQAQSRKIVTSANAQFLRPYQAEPLAIWNSTVGTPVTVSVYGIINNTSLPYNDELWLDVEYLGDGGSPLGTIVSTRKDNLLSGAGSVADDSSVWGMPLSVPVTLETATVASVTLSGGNLVATNTGTTSANQGAMVASTSGKTSGKYYFEATWTTMVGFPSGGNNIGVGVGTIASTYTTMGNVSATTGALVTRSNGNVAVNGTPGVITFGTRAQGEVMGIAVDLDSRFIWFRVAPSGNWNVSSTANPATGIGGLALPAGTMVPFCTFGGSNGVVSQVTTVNFGASSFSGSVPVGYTAGWPA